MKSSGRATRRRVEIGILVAASFRVLTAGAQPAPSSDAPLTTAELEDARSARARVHFERGVSHVDRGEWEAALAEFRASRALVPNRRNTKNAAICLRRLGRVDESLDMFQVLLRDFPDLAPAERLLVEREIAELEASIGTVEILDAPPEASVAADGRERGTTPLSGPLRLAAGFHVLRVTKEGFHPFEARVDVAGGQATQIRAALVPEPTADDAEETEPDHDEPSPDVPRHLELELRVGPAVGLLWGGDLIDGCGDDCAASIPVGQQDELHLVYQAKTGLGFGVHAGFLRITQTLNQRRVSFMPVHLSEPQAVDPGTAHDILQLEGLTVGIETQYAAAEPWPLAVRLAVGILAGSVKDSRSAAFTQSSATMAITASDSGYEVTAYQSSTAYYLLIGPDARVIYPLGDRFSMDVGVKALLGVALRPPRWPKESTKTAGILGNGQFVDASYQTLAGRVVVIVEPTIGLTYAF